MQITRRAGFSLIEALVVLAIGGMALAVIFSIGLKAGDTGFALGRRAMAAADTDVAVNDLRVLIRSLELRPGAMFVEGTDQPLVGTAERLEGHVVLQQATVCAPQGWAGRLSLAVEPIDGGQALVCHAGSRSVPLMSWKLGEQPGFSYSPDGSNWTSDYQSATQAVSRDQFVPEDILWVRLAAAPRTDVIERVTSGFADRWTRPDAS